MQPKFGGKIIDIVSGDIETPQQKEEALSDVKDTILHIFVIVVTGYEHRFCSFHSFNSSICYPNVIGIFVSLYVELDFRVSYRGSLGFFSVQLARHCGHGCFLLLVSESLLD